MKWIAVVLICAGCGLPRDIVGPVDYGDFAPEPGRACPKPETGSGVEAPCS